MQLMCIRAFGNAKPGDPVTVPDGAAFDPDYWEEVPAPPPADTSAAAAVIAGLAAGLPGAKEGA